MTERQQIPDHYDGWSHVPGGTVDSQGFHPVRVSSQLWGDDRCWCRAVECSDSRHCSCGMALCPGHPAPFGEPL